ncbi:neprilysin-2 [Episyrphus balteatus]|uniref:neprilysin-2 n=1 Tax=Episyrphus balteatus TaxID=286459 RepID=UPI0024858AE5|nr:neprilysin-2 [Episyrphus balteatus]
MCSGTFSGRLFSFGILCVLAFCGTRCNFVVVADVVAWNSTIEQATQHFIRQLLASVDNSRSPCDDFHGFICNKQQNSTQFVQRPSEEEIFQKFIQNNDNDDQLMDSELMLKNFYESCQNARTVEHLKKTQLYRITGGWPAIEGGGASRNRESPSWMSVVAAFHDIGVDYFFSHRVEIKSNRRTVELKANSDFKHSLRENTHLAEQLLQNFGMNQAEARLKALDFAGLEGYRREVMAEAGNGVSTSMTYGEFKAKFDNMDWDIYFRRVLGKPLKDTDGIRLEDEQKLELVFSMLSKTPNTRLLNYVWIDYLLDKSTASCLDLVKEYFQPLYRYIVQRTTIDRRRMANMFSEIGSVYQSLLPDSIWIDEISHQKSKLYLGKMIHTTLNGDEKLDADYARLTLTKKNFYRNLEKCQKFTDSTMDSKVAPSTSSSSAVSVSDLYEFFMGPMYNELLPQPLYFGSIGEAFAEKMIDGGGSLTPGSWRSSDSDEKFVEFEGCLREQNGNFALTPAIGNNLVRRILAERQTYEALRNWIAGNVDAVNRIRGLLETLDVDSSRGGWQNDLNLEKLFFFISVYTHCPEDKDFVNTYLKNSRDFAETFGCPSGSRLKPLKVCSVL